MLTVAITIIPGFYRPVPIMNPSISALCEKITIKLPLAGATTN